jgi:hypothetical protein
MTSFLPGPKDVCVRRRIPATCRSGCARLLALTPTRLPGRCWRTASANADQQWPSTTWTPAPR